MDDAALERTMVFCLLDRATTYAGVRRAFAALETNGLITRNGLRRAPRSRMVGVLEEAGYRFRSRFL